MDVRTAVHDVARGAGHVGLVASAASRLERVPRNEAGLGQLAILRFEQLLLFSREANLTNTNNLIIKIRISNLQYFCDPGWTLAMNSWSLPERLQHLRKRIPARLSRRGNDPGANRRSRMDRIG